MNVTSVLAIWGAATGTVGAVVAVAGLYADRPNLQVRREINMNSYKNRLPPALVVSVSNTGKRPIAISEIGLATEWKTVGRVRKRTSPWLYTGMAITEQALATSSPRVGREFLRPGSRALDPGHVILSMESIDGDIRTVRPFARDGLGRTYWAPELSRTEQLAAIEENAERSRYYG
jgi:hypothetical protein